MKKLFSLRIEVLTGVLAAVALVGILAVSGAPTLGVAEGATQFKEGIKSLSAAVVGQDKAKDGLSGACDGDKKGCDKKFAGLSPRCDGDKNKDGKASFAALAPGCDGDKKDCDKQLASLAPGCDGDKKDCDKKAASSLCPLSGAKAINALNTTGANVGCCPKSKPAQTPSVVKDAPLPKLAMAQ